MNSKLIALALFLLTAASVVLYPPKQGVGAIRPSPKPTAAPNTTQHARIDVAFVLDTTGSMGGLLQAAKEKIWSIATSMSQAKPTPRIRMGLVAYRDRGDEYVTKVVDLTADLDSMYAQLMDFSAAGGGDTPESVNQALADAVNKMSWSSNNNAYKVVFLVGDAPPHMDYPQDTPYADTLKLATRMGITINAIQCGQAPSTRQTWQHIARTGGGEFFNVNRSGSAVAVATPFDRKLADLSAKLDATRLYYGDAEDKAKQAHKLAATEKLRRESSIPSRARRATFNATASGKNNFLGEGELVDAVSSGRVALSSIAPKDLPESIQALAPAEQAAVVEEKTEQRKNLQRQINETAQKRSDYLRAKIGALGGARDSLDEKLYRTVRKQAGKKDILLEADKPDY